MQKLYPKEVDRFASITIPRSVTPIAIMLAEKYPQSRELAEKYRRGLRRIIEDGTYRGILETYYGKDRIPENWFTTLRRFAEMYDTGNESP